MFGKARGIHRFGIISTAIILQVNQIPETDPHFKEVRGWIDLIQSRTLSSQRFHTPPKKAPEERVVPEEAIRM